VQAGRTSGHSLCTVQQNKYLVQPLRHPPVVGLDVGYDGAFSDDVDTVINSAWQLRPPR
jgi:hypothetical protein